MTHQDLKEAAMKATPGPWFNEGNTIWIDAREQVCCGRGGQECCGSPDIIGGQEQIGEAGTADAHFIALANPTRVLALIEENERMRATLKGCYWYWPEEDTSSDACSDGPHDIVMDREPGDVIGVSRGGVVETRYYGWLPPLDDADSDDEFWVDEDSPVLAREKIDAEIARRAALKDNQP